VKNRDEVILNRPLAIIDVETTGASPAYDRIIEIAILRIEGGNIVERYSTVIDPETYIPDTIHSLTGITESEIKKAPTFADISNHIRDLIDGCVFVAHNVRFDYGFIKNEFKRLGIRYSAECFCTVKLSRHLFPQYKKHDLTSIITRFDFTCSDRHRAMPDAEVLHDFINHCRKMFSVELLTTTAKKVLGRSSVPPALAPEIVANLPKKPGVYIFYGDNGSKLYIGKSVNIYARVMSHFASDHASSKEMHLAQEVRDIEALETAGELSALLLESHLIKKEQPLYNRMSRRARKLVVITEKQNQLGYKHVALDELGADMLKASDKILGIFRSKYQAKNVLETYVTMHGLCPRLLGLEKGMRDNHLSPCFNSQLGRCGGACAGLETVDAYNIRFDLAFSERRLRAWPFTGPVLVTELNENHSNKDSGIGFIVNEWRLEGSFVFDEAGTRPFLSKEYVFDYDSYKILVPYLLSKKKNRITLATLTKQQANGFLSEL
jgi:DNA polymerase-3 subunit epsilon